MDKHIHMLLLILVMAVVTYIIRLLPMVVFKKKIKSRFVNSLLYYVPYAVLSAMTFPYIMYSSGHVIAAAVGTVTALVAAFTKRSLVTTAILACVAVLAVELVMTYLL